MNNENLGSLLELEPMELVACEGGGLGDEDGLSGEGDLFEPRIDFPEAQVPDFTKCPLPLLPLSEKTRTMLEAAGFELEP